MGLVVANGYGRDPNDCCERGATVHLRFTSEGRPTQYATHSVSPSLLLSLPLHPSPNGSQAATRCCVGSSKRASERSKQFSLMPSPLRSVPPSSARPPSAYEDCLCLLPIVVSQPAESFEQVPRASEQASRRRLLLWRWGSRSRDPVWALPSLPRSPGSAARPPGAGLRASVAVFLSQVWVLVAPPLARSRLRQRRLPVLRRREEERWRRIVVALAHL